MFILVLIYHVTEINQWATYRHVVTLVAKHFMSVLGVVIGMAGVEGKIPIIMGGSKPENHKMVKSGRN